MTMPNDSQTMNPNMQFSNKFAKGQKVWTVFSIDADVKINELEIKAFVAEVAEDATRYLYGFTLDNQGTNNGANMTFLSEDLVFDNKEDAEKRAGERVNELKAQFDGRIQELNKQRNDTMVKYDEELGKLRGMKEKCNANNLEVVVEVVVPPQAEPVTPEMTPDKEQPNPESDVEPTETDNVGETEVKANQDQEG